MTGQTLKDITGKSARYFKQCIIQILIAFLNEASLVIGINQNEREFVYFHPVYVL